ncbi:MAG: ABC-2 transporter permease [Oscillospiraceae bacterium]|jgi:hypothetical protein|nr:ABC-2 transporter permease [Oscillospiraceae bacterium]
MRKLPAFVKLDFVTAKPYLKPVALLVYAAVAGFLTVQSGNLLSGIGVGLMVGTLSLSYPFAVGEKSNMDALYIALAVSRRTVVTGRYIFVLLVDLCAVVFSCLFSLAASFILPGMGVSLDTGGAFAGLAVLAALFVLIQTMQLPIFFKFGYTKAKIASVMPFVFIMAVTAAGLASSPGGLAERMSAALAWAADTPAAYVLACLAFLAFVFASYRLSLAFYKRRDF